MQRSANQQAVTFGYNNRLAVQRIMTVMMDGSIHRDLLRRIAVTGVRVAVRQQRGAVHTAGTARGDAQRAPQVRSSTP